MEVQTGCYSIILNKVNHFMNVDSITNMLNRSKCKSWLSLNTFQTLVCRHCPSAWWWRRPPLSAALCCRGCGSGTHPPYWTALPSLSVGWQSQAGAALWNCSSPEIYKHISCLSIARQMVMQSITCCMAFNWHLRHCKLK